jgi:hypothetical protein
MVLAADRQRTPTAAAVVARLPARVLPSKRWVVHDSDAPPKAALSVAVVDEQRGRDGAVVARQLGAAAGVVAELRAAHGDRAADGAQAEAGVVAEDRSIGDQRAVVALEAVVARRRHDDVVEGHRGADVGPDRVGRGVRQRAAHLEVPQVDRAAVDLEPVAVAAVVGGEHHRAQGPAADQPHVERGLGLVQRVDHHAGG